MKILFDGNKTVEKILGKHKLSGNKTYKWSCFVYPFEYKGIQYVFNNFTKRCYDISDEDFGYSADATFSFDDISKNVALSELAAEHFLVPCDKDENKTYESTVKILRALKRNKGYKGYTILPTTACNARCVYCYEKGIKYVTMTDETVSRLIEFIKETHDNSKEITLHWFGGEPLVGEKIIDRVCSELRADGIKFKSAIVTNGSLIEKATVKKMVDEWNLKSMQITLDGTEQEYNIRKNYYFNYPSAYWHVLERIGMVTESNIHLNIRVNVDYDNVESVKIMLEDLKTVIKNPRNVTIDIAPLFEIQADPLGVKLWEKTFELIEYIHLAGFYHSPHSPVKDFRLTYCMASTPYTHVVVNPEGNLYNCENFRSFDCVGNIWDGITNLEHIKELDAIEPISDKCRNCVSLPSCTTFTRCQHKNASCKYTTVRRMDFALKDRIDFMNELNQRDEEDELDILSVE